MTITFPGFTPANYVVESFTDNGDEQNLEAINDLQGDGEWEDYLLGQKKKGTTQVVIRGWANVPLGTVGKATISDSYGTTVYDENVICVKRPTQNRVAGQIMSTTIEFQKLAPASRLLPASSGATGSATGEGGSP